MVQTANWLHESERSSDVTLFTLFNRINRVPRRKGTFDFFYYLQILNRVFLIVAQIISRHIFPQLIYV
ncbi:hypothetical protein PHET_09868 [Paragonimus heterotremus]|uniref:Uncharacterized protein n=1 Tax=Paragonimus heterotremus TaxID=100268 RepID=A0A8J4SZ49_9TREM|nr:hypothetical protein PHET_09868 [Paragonimus heterotremus]